MARVALLTHPGTGVQASKGSINNGSEERKGLNDLQSRKGGAWMDMTRRGSVSASRSTRNFVKPSSACSRQVTRDNSPNVNSDILFRTHVPSKYLTPLPRGGRDLSSP